MRLSFRLLLLCAAVFCASPAALAESWPKIDEPLRQAGSEKDAAIIIGIDDYIFAPDIPGAADNASAWFRYLVEGRGLPVERAALLRNTEGTREKILRALKTKASEVEPGGTLWVVFIGHGAPSPDTHEGVLVGVDAQQEADGLFARSISQSEILSAVKGGQQSKTVLLIDACFSGRAPDGQPLAPGLQPLVLVNDNNKIPDDVFVFTAGQSDQFAGPLPGLKRPAFSYLMLGALRGWADRDGDAQVSAQEALDYTRVTLSATLKDRTQTPTLMAVNRATVLSAPASEYGPDLSKILSGSESNSRPVHSGGNGVVRLEAKDGGEYNLSVLTGDGSEYSCDGPVTQKAPCTLKNLPQGRIVLRVTGDMEREEITTLGSETIVLGADGAAGWYGWTAIGCAAGGFIASIVFVTSASADNDVDAGADDSFSALTITGIALTPILWTSSLVFGVLWFLDDDKFSSQRFDSPQTSADDPGLAVNWGFTASQDGGMLGLQLTW